MSSSRLLVAIVLPLTILMGLYALPAAYGGQSIPSQASRVTSQDPLAPTSNLPTWQFVGPSAISNCFLSSYSCSGRVTAIAIDPSDPSTIYIGGAEGGVWKSIDGGTNWTPLTDDQPSLAVGSIAIDPSGTTIYVGTGNRYGGCTGYWGAGILKSTDSGETWVQLGEDSADTNFGRLAITSIVVSPDDPDIVIASTIAGSTNSATYACSPVDPLASTGVYISTDGGDSWTLSQPGRAANDLVLDPDSPSTVYAALDGGVYKSTDNGMPGTWEGPLGQSGGGLPSPLSIGRVSLAISKPSGTIYADMQCRSSQCSGELFSSPDGGSTWSLMPTPNFCGNCGYVQVIAADPVDANTLYLGGEDLWRTTDGGAAANSWTDVGGYSGFIHPDQHVLAFNPTDHTQVYVGNDGGIWFSPNADSCTVGACWTDLNSGLGLTQFYSLAAHPTDPDLYFGGTQDNGIIRRVGSSLIWETLRTGAGDGGWTAYNSLDPQVMYASSVGVSPIRSDDGGLSWHRIASGICDAVTNVCEHSQPFAAMAIDPSAPSTLYLGTYRLWKTTDGGDNWSPTVPGLSLPPANPVPPINTCDPTANDCISAISVAEGGQFVYVGTKLGKLFASNDGGNNFVQGTGPDPLSFVTKIAVNPLHPEQAFATFSGFDVPHVLATSDGGVTWIDISGDLPNVPADSLIVDSSGSVIVGTDVGIFVSFNGRGPTPNEEPRWTVLGQGFPHTPVYELAFSATGQILAATHGRGVWTAPLRLHHPEPPPNSRQLEPSWLLPDRNEIGQPSGADNGLLVRDNFGGLAQPLSAVKQSVFFRAVES